MKVNRLHFLHANHFSQPRVGTQIGTSTLHYQDGSSVTIPLRYGIESADWWTYSQARAVVPVAWQGRNEAATDWDRQTDFELIVGRPLGIQLFLMTWRNPRPEDAIKSLDVVSFRAPGTPIALPFLVAVTGE